MALLKLVMLHFYIIGQILLPLSNVIFEEQLLLVSQRFSYITFLCKESNKA